MHDDLCVLPLLQLAEGCFLAFVSRESVQPVHKRHESLVIRLQAVTRGLWSILCAYLTVSRSGSRLWLPQCMPAEWA